MVTTLSHFIRSGTSLLIAVLLLAACTDGGIVEPGSRPTPFAGNRVNADVVVTPNYSAYDTRAEFDGAGVNAHLNEFEDGFTGAVFYVQTTPWLSHGITYTSALNVILGPGVGLGVQSNAMSTQFGAPLTGEFAASDAFTTFGTDISLFGEKVPVGLVVTTNLATYSFDNLDIPLAVTGRRFLGLTLSQPGEYFTGFQFTPAGAGTAPLLDNIAVGHVATSVNVEPEASVGGPYTGAEGSSIALTMSASDADNDALVLSWDLGDGTTGSGATPPESHVYADNGTYEIVLAIADGRGGVDTARTTASVSNVAPVLAAFAVPTTPIALSGGGVTVPITTTFSDPGSDSHVATLDCGTGVTAESNAPNGTAGGTCTFAGPGVYTVQLTVLDDDGDSDTEIATGQVVIYAASAGWITGGGWIDSPAGAYAADASVSGKLAFELVARYQSSSASIPSGSAELTLSVGGLDFRSTALDWLVVSRSTAHLQGSGRLNGAGDFGFSVAASDGPDTIRIRIWNRVTGAVVYDNKPTGASHSEDVTLLGGGSIQIHSR